MGIPPIGAPAAEAGSLVPRLAHSGVCQWAVSELAQGVAASKASQALLSVHALRAITTNQRSKRFEVAAVRRSAPKHRVPSLFLLARDLLALLARLRQADRNGLLAALDLALAAGTA